jgi:hypothetical protein
MNLQVKDDHARPECDRRFLDFELVTNDAQDGQPSARCFLVINTSDMLHRAIEWGKKRPFFMDTTFGIAQYRFSFLTISVMKDHYHGVLVCWAFTPNEEEVTINRVLTTFYSALVDLPPDFRCSSLLTDDCMAEQNAAR